MPIPASPTGTAADPADAARRVSALLDDLDEAQRRAVESSAAPLRILAGAGSGKTRVLTRRIAYRAAIETLEPRRTLALTFTRKAAGELNNRLRALGLRDAVAAGTFHAIAYAQLRLWWSDSGRGAPTLLDRKVGFVGRLLPRGSDSTAALDVVSEIEWAKARRVTPEAYEAAAAKADRRPGVATALVADVFARYEREKAQRRLVDFDDLLGLCARVFATDLEFAAAQRWRFRHLFVDEFQDVNPLQLAVLRAWLGERPDLCVVGDPNQAIYSWNGADADYLVNFPKHFPGGDTVELRRNYRSTPQILHVARAVLGDTRTAAIADAQRSSGPLPRLRSLDNDVTEARAIARAVRDAHGPGQPWNHQAVLVRTNGQIPVLEEAFRAARIPFRTRGGGLLARPEVKQLLRQLERSRRPFEAVLADLDAEAAPVADAELDLTGHDPELDLTADRYDGADPDDATSAAGGAAPRALSARAQAAESLARLGHEYLTLAGNGGAGGGDASGEASTASFVAWLSATVGNDEPDEKADAVDLATFHAAKGLEWPVVHLAGLEAGLVPIAHARSPEATAEEQRLLYVAITRAERELNLSWARERTFGNRTGKRSPSPYLERVAEAARGMGAQLASHDLGARAAAERAKLRSSKGEGRSRDRRNAEPDSPLLAALKQWRSTKARAANVPAYVVFSDATLAAIAEHQPRNPRALLQISGLGPVKVERYGAEVLAIVADHA